MMMQAFLRECASLHHDLLQIIEEALGLWDDELVSVGLTGAARSVRSIVLLASRGRLKG